MCDACEDWDAREPRQAGMQPRLAARARDIERGMPGAPLPDAAWRIALGEETGAIAWADHLRILSAFQAAAAKPDRPAPFVRRRRGGSLNCAAAG
jgi:hypothetical protein